MQGMVKPNLNDIKALIEQAEKLKREIEQLKKKSFLTPVQSEAIKAGTGTDIALYLLRLSYTNREECENNFGIVDSYFTLTGSLNSGRFAQNLGDRYTDDCGEKPERIEWYNPNKHTGLFVRYDFDEKKFRQSLNQYTAKQRQLYWENHIQPLIIQLDTDLTPWLPFMKSYIDTEEIQEAIKTAEPATLSDAIYKIKKIQKVIETEVRQETAEIQPAGGKAGDRKLTPAEEKAYQSYDVAINQKPELAGKTDKEVYDWLKTNGIDDYILPTFNTWQRQVRAGRNKYGTQKNAPRGGRTSPSVKSSKDIKLTEITNRFIKKVD